jgi:hypothetical protein
MEECFEKGLLKKTSPDMENALRSLERILIFIEKSK